MINRRLACFAFSLSVLVLLVFGLGVVAQEKSDTGGAAAKEGSKPEAKAEDDSRAQLEKRFRDTLTNATLTGRWRLVTDGKLGKEREEKYSISAATKVSKDYWLITARIQYAGRDVTVPVPVKLQWAGDTPVVTLTDVSIPGLGTFTARVMFYRDHYSGMWWHGDVGGNQFGRIVRDTENSDEE